MAYVRGNSSNIIVGAASVFVANAPITPSTVVNFNQAESYRTTLAANVGYTNVGYTMNGLELQFNPDFGEVKVDQILDVAKLYKQGMVVNLVTAFAESTLENLLIAIAGESADLGLSAGKATSAGQTLNLSAGDLGECPIERGIAAVGPGTGDCTNSPYKERVYLAYRALSIQNVNVSAKRDAATTFEVTFRLLPDDTSSSYGKIVDRTHSAINS